MGLSGDCLCGETQVQSKPGVGMQHVLCCGVWTGRQSAGTLVLPGAAGFQYLAGMLGRAEGGSLLGRVRYTRVQAHTVFNS